MPTQNLAKWHPPHSIHKAHSPIATKRTIGTSGIEKQRTRGQGGWLHRHGRRHGFCRGTFGGGCRTSRRRLRGGRGRGHPFFSVKDHGGGITLDVPRAIRSKVGSNFHIHRSGGGALIQTEGAPSGKKRRYPSQLIVSPQDGIIQAHVHGCHELCIGTKTKLGLACAQWQYLTCHQGKQPQGC